MKVPAFLIKILSERFRLLSTIVVIIILILGYLTLISAKIQTIRTTGFLEKNNVQAELDNRKQLLSDLRDSIQRFEVAFPAERLKAVDEFIPSTDDFPGLLLTINNIASSANLQLDSISITSGGQVAATGPTANAEASDEQTVATAPTTAQAAAAGAGVTLQVQNVAITVSGGQTYTAFKNFVALLESSQRLLDVISLGFSVGSSVPGESSSSGYSLQLRTYYLPSKAR